MSDEIVRNSGSTDTPSTSIPPRSSMRDRVREFRRVPASELLDNDGNPRRHPQAQREVLEQVGVAGAWVAVLADQAILETGG